MAIFTRKCIFASFPIHRDHQKPRKRAGCHREQVPPQPKPRPLKFPFLSKEGQEDGNQFGVEVFSRIFTDVSQGFFFRPSLAVRAVAGQGIVDVHNGEDARLQRDFFPLQAARVAAAVPFFMVAIRDIECGAQIFDG